MCARGWRSSAHRGRASSRRETSSANGWSATSTTEPSSASSALARAPAAALAGPSSRRLEDAEEELRQAIRELRELAHGIFPAVLADEGLAAAVEALAEDGAVPIRIGGLPEERLPRPSSPPPTRSWPKRCGRRRARSPSRRTARAGGSPSTWRQRPSKGSTSSACRIASARSTGGSTSSGTTDASRCERSCRAVVIADDETLLREGLASLLSQAGIDVVGKAGTGDQVLGASSSHGRTWRSWTSGCRRPTPTRASSPRRRSAPRIRPSACSSSRTTSSRATRCGCSRSILERSGYLLKERVSDVAVLVDALERIHQGECVLDPTIVARLVGRAREESPPTS